MRREREKQSVLRVLPPKRAAIVVPAASLAQPPIIGSPSKTTQRFCGFFPPSAWSRRSPAHAKTLEKLGLQAVLDECWQEALARVLFSNACWPSTDGPAWCNQACLQVNSPLVLPLFGDRQRGPALAVLTVMVSPGLRSASVTVFPSRITVAVVGTSIVCGFLPSKSSS